jgi:hypothetical protein
MFILLSIMAVFRNAIILFALYQLFKYLFAFWVAYYKKSKAENIKSAKKSAGERKGVVRPEKYIDFKEIKNNG